MIDDRAIMLAREAQAHLGAALAQTIPSDDQIIIGHIREAKQNLFAAMRLMEATQS